MISGGNATVYVSDMDAAVRFYTERLGLKLTNRFGAQWTTVETGPSCWTGEGTTAGLTIGLHPHSPKYPTPGTRGGVGFGLETRAPIEEVVARLRERGVRVEGDIIEFEAGKVVRLVDQDGTDTYIWECTPEMLPHSDLGVQRKAPEERVPDLVSGGHAIVYVFNMDAAIRFYTETLGLKLTFRYGDNIATVEAGRLVVAIHPQTPRTPTPGTKGSVMLGLSIDEPIDRVVSRLTARGVRITGPIIKSEANRFVEIADPDGNAVYLWEGDSANQAGTLARSQAVSAD